MGERSAQPGCSGPAVGLAILGVLVLVFGVLQGTFGCFMVVDPACSSEAGAKATPLFLLGIGLLVAAILVGSVGGRQGRDGHDDGDRRTRPRGYWTDRSPRLKALRDDLDAGRISQEEFDRRQAEILEG